MKNSELHPDLQAENAALAYINQGEFVKQGVPVRADGKLDFKDQNTKKGDKSIIEKAGEEMDAELARRDRIKAGREIAKGLSGEELQALINLMKEKPEHSEKGTIESDIYLKLLSAKGY